jgi:hypothetical protein
LIKFKYVDEKWRVAESVSLSSNAASFSNFAKSLNRYEFNFQNFVEFVKNIHFQTYIGGLIAVNTFLMMRRSYLFVNPREQKSFTGVKFRHIS